MAQFPLFFRLRLFTDQNFLSALGTFFRRVLSRDCAINDTGIA